MTKMELEARVEELNNWTQIIEEAQAEAEAIKDSLKAEMMEREVEELEAGKYIIRWSEVLSNRFDSTSFKKVYADLYKAFTKPVLSRRFQVC